MRVINVVFSTVFFMSNLAFAGGRSNELTVSDQLLHSPSVSAKERVSDAASILDFSVNSYSLSCLVQDPDFYKPALVFNDTQMLEDSSKFSFRNTLSQLVATNPSTGGNASSLMQSMLDSFSLTVIENEGAGVSMSVDLRAGEANMNALELINTMRPTAVFNRFDLAAADGSHCGEYRIVYHKAVDRDPSGRFFLIFEAQYPNPQPNLGLEGCRPVAKFWNTLPHLSGDEQLEELEAFFYEGVVSDGVALTPVIDFENFSSGSGQVRSNHVINFNKWQLREFNTASGLGQTVFSMTTVKANPLAQLYQDASAVSSTASLSLTQADAYVNRFQAQFMYSYIDQLLTPELNGFTNADDIINGVNLHNDNRFNEFQSDAQGLSDVPTLISGGDFEADIASHLRGTDITPDMLMNRANAMTCGGCHQTATNHLIAPGVLWPRSAGFVHVTESGNLSSALEDVFLPARKAVLETFLCDSLPAVSDFHLEGNPFTGEVVMDWNAVQSAMYYEIYKSASSNSGYTFFSRVFGLSKSTQVLSNTFFKVRACNNSGCGTFSPAKQVTYRPRPTPTPLPTLLPDPIDADCFIRNGIKICK